MVNSKSSVSAFSPTHGLPAPLTHTCCLYPLPTNLSHVLSFRACGYGVIVGSNSARVGVHAKTPCTFKARSQPQVLFLQCARAANPTPDIYFEHHPGAQ